MNLPCVLGVMGQSKTSIFAVVSRLAREHGAINLGQGLPLLPSRGLGSPARDPAFAAPQECSPKTRHQVAMLNDVHHSWESRKLFCIDSRMRGLPSPLSVVNTPRERKSPSAVCDRLRRWMQSPITSAQARQRASLRLLRDGVLAAMRYYALDPHDFDLPTDTDILMWSPHKVRTVTTAARRRLFAQILLCELPEAESLPPCDRPRMALHVNIQRQHHPPLSAEECYIAFTPPKPFWRREGDPLFCIPMLASSSQASALFAGLSIPQTFARRGRMRFRRLGPGHFVPHLFGDDGDV